MEGRGEKFNTHGLTDRQTYERERDRITGTAQHDSSAYWITKLFSPGPTVPTNWRKAASNVYQWKQIPNP